MQVDLKTVMVLGAVAVAGVAVWRVSKAAGSAAGQVIDAAGRAWDAAGDAAWAVTPWNNDNAIYGAVNNTLFPDKQDTLGTWLYGVFNEPKEENKPENRAFYVPEGWDVTPQGANGPRYNNPSAYIAPVGAASIYR